MFFGGVEMLILTVVFWLVSVWVFYMIIKAAVRNGILEADAQRDHPRRPRTGPTNERLQRQVEEGRLRDTLDGAPARPRRRTTEGFWAPAGCREE